MFFSVLPEICDIECDTHYLLDSYTECFFFFLSFSHDFFHAWFLPQKNTCWCLSDIHLHCTPERTETLEKKKKTCSTKRWCRTGSPANTPYSPFLFVFCLFLVVCLFFLLFFLKTSGVDATSRVLKLVVKRFGTRALCLCSWCNS